MKDHIVVMTEKFEGAPATVFGVFSSVDKAMEYYDSIRELAEKHNVEYGLIYKKMDSLLNSVKDS